jgi:aspartyl-tRNA(Asn)/glutamyl-tRNA(Gln) amidotransferase subunit C
MPIVCPFIYIPAMTISREDVIHVAKLARLELSEAEIAQLTVQLSDILEHADRLQGLDTSDVPPTSHPIPLANVLREDEPGPTVDRDAFLAQAPAAEDGYVRVPRIMDEPSSGSGS